MREKYGTFDERSERNIATLLPKAQEVARRWLKAATSRARELLLIKETAEKYGLAPQLLFDSFKNSPEPSDAAPTEQRKNVAP